MSDKKYSHVIVVGIDGAGAFIEQANTPNFDRIFENGAVTYGALASKPTISAECWGSMLLGVGPEVHKLTNGIVDDTPYPLDSPFPSVFKRIKEVMPDAELGSFCEWSPITTGIVESNLNVSTDCKCDTELTPVICDYIKDKKPDFLFIQLDSVDGAGHSFGYGLEKHLERISIVDGFVNDIYTAAVDAGIIEDTLFMVIADHGGDGYGHGGWTDQEKYVTFAATGKGVNKCNIEAMNIRDLAAIILYAFGIDAPAFDEAGWTAQIPLGIWNDGSITDYRDISHLAGAASRISRVHHTSELV